MPLRPEPPPPPPVLPDEQQKSVLGWTFWVPVALYFAAITCIAFCGACSRAALSGQDVAGALDVYAATLEPAYRLVREGCKRADLVVFAAEESSALSKTAADALIDKNRVRCDALVETFEAMKATHDHAADAYQHGELESARDDIALLASLWAETERDGGTP